MGSEVVVTVIIGVLMALWAANEEARSQRRRRVWKITPRRQAAQAVRTQP